MWRNRESAEIKEEKWLDDEEKPGKKKRNKEKKETRRWNNRLKKQEKKVSKTRSDIKEENSEVINEILQDNPILRQKKIICFDLYGTLIYRPHSHWKIKHILKKIKIEPFKKYYEVIQTNRKEDVKSVYDSLEGFKMPIRAIRALQKHTDEEVRNTKIYNETLTVLKKLKESWYKLALISNLSEDFVKPYRKLIPENIFDYEVFSYEKEEWEEAWVLKPDKAIFEKVLKKANNEIKKTDGINELTMNDLVMIWDSMKSDVLWAKNAWMDGILLDRKKEKDKNIEKINYNSEKQLITIHTLADLLDILWID